MLILAPAKVWRAGIPTILFKDAVKATQVGLISKAELRVLLIHMFDKCPRKGAH